MKHFPLVSLTFRTRRFQLTASVLTFCCFLCLFFSAEIPALAQDNVTGAFVGRVTDAFNKPVAGALIQFTNDETGVTLSKISDDNGDFRQGSLLPGIYTITVSLQGYKTAVQKKQIAYSTQANPVVPVPVRLEKEQVPEPVVTPSPGQPQPPVVQATPAAQPALVSNDDDDVLVLSLDPRRDAAFSTTEIHTLPLGGSTLTRSFDELALLAPGVAPPPQSLGNGSGPGVGPGVGTSGQFAVNGLRSRANNFTVDGSDNNDEDIGVRRQGFIALVPQPIESVREFQIITALAPAQYGRNLGAQVNVNSLSGGNELRGTVFGFFNSHRLNARNFFDYVGGNVTQPLTARRRNGTEVNVFVDNQQQFVTNDSGKEDSFTLFQGGAAVGGQIVPNRMFFFASGERQILNAVQEAHFAVPTVEQRGLFGTGAEGNMGNLIVPNTFPIQLRQIPVVPTSQSGDAIFSLFPFPNDPNGIFGRNTLTQTLPANGRGTILSGRYDYNFRAFGKTQFLTARYNFTDDQRDIPVVGEALFSSLRSLVRTDNFSTFVSGDVTNNVSNVLRFSYGRTRLKFNELRDNSYLLPVRRQFNNPEDARFLLNARRLLNTTLPGSSAATYVTSGETETAVSIIPSISIFGQSLPQLTSSLGPIGQLNIAGFSPVGVDVFNFPQERVNNTFQLADIIRLRAGGNHNIAFGTDNRYTILDSNLPRNSRPLVTFFGGGNLESIGLQIRNDFPDVFTPTDLAATGAASGFFQSLVAPGRDAQIKLSYFQLNFFAQDDWRILRNLNFSYGVRYEYNTVPKEADNKIEQTFNQPIPSFLSGLADFLEGRQKIFDSDPNNFAPRVGLSYAPTTKTVLRAGYGMYFDQIIGSVVSQSRNVFPTFNTLNLGGGLFYFFDPPINKINRTSGPFTLFNPLTSSFAGIPFIKPLPIVQPGTINTINPNLDPELLRRVINSFFPFYSGSSFSVTLPRKTLETPFSHQYSAGIEQQIFRNTFLSAAYVGTTGRNLLRFTTPNLGSNYLTVIESRISLAAGGGQIFTIPFSEGGRPLVVGNQPLLIGFTTDPFSRFIFDPVFPVQERPNPRFGPVNQFETTGRSRYNALQIQLRGRFTDRFQYQANYTYGQVKDDVSDVFDLAGAPALPQNSLTFDGEYAPANFDVRHRIAYNFIYDLPQLENTGLTGALLGGWRIAGTGRYNTGQPFTVNTVYDINFDGNLTDRLNNTNLIVETDNRSQPLQLTTTNATQLLTMLAAFNTSGAVPRNSFRSSDRLEIDLAFDKRFAFNETQNLQFRVEIFNLTNRANFGIPVRYLEAPGFGRSFNTVTPARRIQLGLKYNF